MAVKIRLARKGRKKKAFFHIVVADSRSPRDGRYIEKIGFYNPLTNPATIEIDFEKTLGWLHNGAIPTETCRAILSYKGVLLKKHLLEGVKKGAFDEAEANRRFDEWIRQQEARIDTKKSGLEKSREEALRKQLAEEKRINEARSAELARKQAKLAAMEAGDSDEGAPAEDVQEEAAETAEAADTVTASEEAAEAAETVTASEETAEAAETVTASEEITAAEAGTETPDTPEAEQEPEEKPQE